jgi:hypothetical protein
MFERYFTPQANSFQSVITEVYLSFWSRRFPTAGRTPGQQIAYGGLGVLTE